MSLQITVSHSAAKTYCGGSLIAANFVLTSAACLRNATSIQVDLGSIEFLKPYRTLHTTQYIRHPQYEDEFKSNNIAVIRLQQNVTFRTNIRAILLPGISQRAELYENAESYVAGFGVSALGSNYLSNELRYAHTTVISNNKCRQSYDSRFIKESVMCAIGFNGTTQSFCYGDEGGALVSHIAGSWVQIGISSIVHPSGCTGIIPATFTRITPYLQWISSLTGIALNP